MLLQERVKAEKESGRSPVGMETKGNSETNETEKGKEKKYFNLRLPMRNSKCAKPLLCARWSGARRGKQSLKTQRNSKLKR
jgi:hypothetical protein